MSLFIAIAVWFIIFTQLEPEKPTGPPIPGTDPEQIPIPETHEPKNPLLPKKSIIPGG